LLFHAIVEGFAIIVAVLIYVLGTRTYKYSKNNMFLFLGISYLHVAILDFTHLLTYKGMGVFPGFGSDPPTQLWIAGRFVEAITLFIVPFVRRRQINRRLITCFYSLFTVAMLLSIMVFKVFPTCFVEGQGLTAFKIISEYIIIGILFVSAYILYLRRGFFGNRIIITIGASILITALSEFAFTLYSDVYGIFNAIGHILKIVSYYFIYTGVVAQGIEEPYSVISAELKDMAIKDGLTSLYNRTGMVTLMEREMEQAEEGANTLGLLMIDLDNFKEVNDNYGHLYDDKVLKMFASLLKNNIRENDTACRFGGDEFVILMQAIDSKGLNFIK
jgi:predicted signal transduction protein with EAL and GGDEF domain